MKDIGLNTILYLKSFLYQTKSGGSKDSKKKNKKERKRYLRDVFRNYSNDIS